MTFTPAPSEMELSDEQIRKIAQTLPKPDTGRPEDHPSWGHGYSRDANGKNTIPIVPNTLIPFPRAVIEADRKLRTPPAQAPEDGAAEACARLLDAEVERFSTHDRCRRSAVKHCAALIRAKAKEVPHG